MATDLPRGPRLVGRYALLVLVSVIVIGPIYVVLIGALKRGDQFLRFPQSLLPTHLTLETIRKAWDYGKLSHYLAHSVWVAAVVTIGQLFTSVLAAYAFAYLRFPAKKAVFWCFLATLMVPAEATVLVNVRTIQSFGWIDSYKALTIPFLATAFGTFLIRQVFRTVPTDLRDAAMLDGLGHWGFLREVAVPLARPTLGALALFSFLGSWNQYLWPLLVTNNDNVRTVQVGLKSLSSANVDALNLIMAGTVVAALPILIALFVFQRQLVRGLTAGAVKG